MKTPKYITKRLEYLRTELQNERISYGELAELASLVKYIDKSDVELLEAAGVPETPQPKTDVIFRKYRNGEIIALFPYEFWSDRFISSYMHFGQHGGADYSGTVQTTKLASESDHKELFDELISLGYDLNVIKKISRKKAEFAMNFK